MVVVPRGFHCSTFLAFDGFDGGNDQPLMNRGCGFALSNASTGSVAVQ